uniref:Uncharacterized protein n=1 Tax=Octopus bimaculoides TaxID=37653 RepID=A0A0L8FLZ6_OCTBM
MMTGSCSACSHNLLKYQMCVYVCLIKSSKIFPYDNISANSNNTINTMLKALLQDTPACLPQYSWLITFHLYCCMCIQTHTYIYTYIFSPFPLLLLLYIK